VSNEALLISIISGLLVLLQVLVGWIFTSTVNDLKERLARQDQRHETYVKDKERFDYEFRHDEYGSRVQQIELRLANVERLPQRVEQLWSRVFNGGSK
jgi:hypothetical protein